MKKTTRLLRTSKTELIARCLAACFAVGVTTLSIAGLDVRAFPEDQLPNDSRLAPPKDLNGYFPFRLPTTLDDWEQRASQLRRHLLVMNGLWPMPTRTPLNPVIHGKLDQGDYTVEKVYFESFPGFYVTGSLYRPKGFEGPRPGVLSPHGHWSNGRFTENLDIWNDLNQGAERFENGGRSPLQSRNVQLARMGCVVFHYDMVGYADSIQITEDLAHHFNVQRPEMNHSERWGFFSPQAESNLQSIMGLQTWNSIRSLDFLETLPDVDTARLSITGASGGGTQSFMMGALDSRLAACFPAVMVSTAMQGGCTCENASGLRIPAGNVEIAALFAPKPLGMTGANDWTVEMTTKGFPELKKLFTLYGQEDNVSLAQLNHFGHNYNYVSRSAMYHFMNQHLNLNLALPIVEQDYERLDKAALTVWSHGHDTPEGGPDFERDLLRHWHEDNQRKLQASHQSPHAFRNVHGPGIEAIIGRTFERAGNVELELPSKSDKGSSLEMVGMLKNTTHDEAVPTLFLYPSEWNGRTWIWPTENGKSGLLNSKGRPRPIVQRALDAGCSVVGLDLLMQGEVLPPTEEASQNRLVSNPREFAGYTYGYNSPLFAQRVHDILSLVAYVHHNEKRPSESIELIGLNGAGHWIAAARAMCQNVIDRSAIQTQGFRFGDLTDFKDLDFLHGGAKYGDLPGMLALGSPSELWVANEEKDSETLLRNIYASSGFPARLTMTSSGNASMAIQWLLERD